MLVPTFKLVLHTVAMSIKALVASWNQLLYAFIEDGHYEDSKFCKVFPLLVTSQTLAGPAPLQNIV